MLKNRSYFLIQNIHGGLERWMAVLALPTQHTSNLYCLQVQPFRVTRRMGHLN